MTWRVLTGFQMSLSEVLEDLMDPNKAGDVVRRLGEASGTFLETFVQIQALEPFQDYQFPLWHFRDSWEDILVSDNVGNGVKGLGKPLGSFTKKFVEIGQQVPC